MSGHSSDPPAASTSRFGPLVGPGTLALFWSGLAAAYSLLPLASGLHVQFSSIDFVAAIGFWGVLGLVVGATCQRRLALRHGGPILSWTIAASLWAGIEAVFMVIVVIKPTRWPPVVFSALGLVVPGLVAAGIAFWALRRAAREAPLGGMHPAVVVVASWTSYAAWLLWAPRWLRTFSDAPNASWLAWGAVDVLWLLTSILGVVTLSALILVHPRKRMRMGVATAAFVGLQFLPMFAGSPTPRDSATQADAPNVVWIIVDSVRTDHVGAYGYARPTMPNFDQLALRGTLVKSHVSAGARTENTYAKMLPLRDELDGWEQAIPAPLSAVRNLLPAGWVPTQPGVVDSLERSGYETALFHAYYDLLEDRGLQPWLQTFDHAYATRRSGDMSAGSYLVRMIFGDRLDGLPRMDRWALLRRRYFAEDVHTAAIRYLDQRNASRPLFMIIHLAGGHSPFYTFGKAPSLAAEPGMSSVVARYDNALRSADEQLKQLVTTIRARLGSDVQLFVFADHGTKFEGTSEMPAYINVPLLIDPPLPAAPTMVTSSQDIAATTLGIARGTQPRCDARLAKDLRCSSHEAPPRVIDHTGHGHFVLAGMLDHQLVTLDLTRSQPVATTVGRSDLEACTVLRTFGSSTLTVDPSPLERHADLPSRLERALRKCGDSAATH